MKKSSMMMGDQGITSDKQEWDRDIKMNQTMDRFSRRAFAQRAITASMVAVTPATLLSSTIQDSASSRVVVVRNTSVFDDAHRVRPNVIVSMLSRGLMRLTDTHNLGSALGSFFTPSQRIAIKSNLHIHPPHSAVHKAFLNSLACLGVSSDRMRIWDRNRGGIGIHQWDSSRWNWQPGYDSDCISRPVQWADSLVNLFALKTNSHTGLSGAVKNWAGAVTDINCRDENVSFPIHAHHGAELGQINALPAIRGKCRLIIADALNPLVKQNGKRHTLRFNGLILGTDPVAVDRVCWALLQNQFSVTAPPTTSSVPIHLTVADQKYRLGHSRLEKIEMIQVG